MFLCQNQHFFPGRPVVSGPSGCSRCSKRAFTTAGTWSCRMTTGEETLAWPISPRRVKCGSQEWAVAIHCLIQKVGTPILDIFGSWCFPHFSKYNYHDLRYTMVYTMVYIPHLQTHPNLSPGGVIQRHETHPFLGPDPPISPPHNIAQKFHRSLRWGKWVAAHLIFSFDKKQEPRPKSPSSSHFRHH